MTRLAWLAVATVVAGCASDDAKLGPAIAVKLAPVARAGAPAGIHYSAQIVPATTISVAFKVGGYVESVAMVDGADGESRIIQRGDPVSEGMQLVALRKAEFLHRIAEARAARASAAAAANQARIELGRTRTLVASEAAPAADLDAAKTQLRTTSAGVGGAQAMYAEARTAMADAALDAPLDGVVLERSVDVGELVAPGTVAFVVADTSSVKAIFGVPDMMLSRIAIGTPETVATDAYPGEEFAGTISLIAPSADAQSRVFEVHVTIPNLDGRLKTGTVASLVLDTAHEAALGAPLVPISAIVRSPFHPDKFAVFVVEEKDGHTIARAREVELDDYLGRDVPVKSGLAETDRIVVQGAKLVADGEEVEVLP